MASKRKKVIIDIDGKPWTEQMVCRYRRITKAQLHNLLTTVPLEKIVRYHKYTIGVSHRADADRSPVLRYAGRDWTLKQIFYIVHWKGYKPLQPMSYRQFYTKCKNLARVFQSTDIKVGLVEELQGYGYGDLNKVLSNVSDELMEQMSREYKSFAEQSKRLHRKVDDELYNLVLKPQNLDDIWAEYARDDLDVAEAYITYLHTKLEKMGRELEDKQRTIAGYSDRISQLKERERDLEKQLNAAIRPTQETEGVHGEDTRRQGEEPHKRNAK